MSFVNEFSFNCLAKNWMQSLFTIPPVSFRHYARTLPNVALCLVKVYQSRKPPEICTEPNCRCAIIVALNAIKELLCSQSSFVEVAFVVFQLSTDFYSFKKQVNKLLRMKVFRCVCLSFLYNCLNSNLLVNPRMLEANHNEIGLFFKPKYTNPLYYPIIVKSHFSARHFPTTLQSHNH